MNMYMHIYPTHTKSPSRKNLVLNNVTLYLMKYQKKNISSKSAKQINKIEMRKFTNVSKTKLDFSKR